VLIPSGLVTLASVAIPSLLAQEATARSSFDQQLRAQPALELLLLKIIITLHYITKLPKSPQSSSRLSKFQTLNIYKNILSFALSKLSWFLFF
jgi:hypothetical protein